MVYALNCRRTIGVFVLLMSSPISTVSVDVQEPYVSNVKAGFRLRDHVFKTKAVGTLLSCGHLCMNTPGCGSINFSKLNGVCELNSATSSDLDAEAGSIYMEIGQDYEVIRELGSCWNHGCVNNATCTVISPCADSLDGPPFQHRCDCVEGFRGLRCEKVIQYTNVAIGKPAWQSSTMYGGVASTAVDGSTIDRFLVMEVGGHCTHTATNRLNPWWMVDLQKSYLIRWINITNRSECCSDRIVSSEVRVGLSSVKENNDICGSKITEINPSVTSQILLDCVNLFGRFVSVQRTDDRTVPISLCEVEVFARDPEWEVMFLGAGRSDVNLYQLFLDGTAIGNVSTVSAISTENYVNEMINRWDKLYIKYVKLSLFKDGVEEATILFDGVGSNRTDWFTPNRILASSWTDLSNTTDALMSGNGFLVNVADGVGNCNTWSGWLLVADRMTTGCDWLPNNVSSVIMYSTLQTNTTWNQSNKEEADIMMIHVYYRF